MNLIQSVLLKNDSSDKKMQRSGVEWRFRLDQFCSKKTAKKAGNQIAEGGRGEKI